MPAPLIPLLVKAGKVALTKGGKKALVKSVGKAVAKSGATGKTIVQTTKAVARGKKARLIKKTQSRVARSIRDNLVKGKSIKPAVEKVLARSPALQQFAQGVTKAVTKVVKGYGKYAGFLNSLRPERIIAKAVKTQGKKFKAFEKLLSFQKRYDKVLRDRASWEMITKGHLNDLYKVLDSKQPDTIDGIMDMIKKVDRRTHALYRHPNRSIQGFIEHFRQKDYNQIADKLEELLNSKSHKVKNALNRYFHSGELQELLKERYSNRQNMVYENEESVLQELTDMFDENKVGEMWEVNKMQQGWFNSMTEEQKTLMASRVRTVTPMGYAMIKGGLRK